MSSVWVVEGGEYSDYHVIGIFSSKQNADRVAAMHPKVSYSETEVNEWDLDPCVDKVNKGLHVFDITMEPNGDTRKCEPDDWTDCTELYVRGAGWYGGPCVQGRVWAKDKKHAVKIANEFRAQAIANNLLETSS